MSSDGGVAMRLTSHPADERRSAFSPDGTHLAFESDRVGSRSIYMMPLIEVGDSAPGGPVVGGEISRVTVAPTGQTLGGFTADGESVIFASNQDPSIYRMARMFTAPLDGGPVERVTPAFGTLPRQGADGTVVFNRGYWNWERPAYRGPGDLDLWTMSPDGTFTQRTFSDGNDGDGHVLPDGSIVFVSSRDGQNNVWHLGANTDDRGTSLRQLTRFAPTQTEGTIAHGVRDLAVCADGTTAAFCVWDTLYTLDLPDASAEPVALAPVASVDSDALDHDRIDLDRRVGEAALSPDGNTMAVAARGEIFVRSTEDDRPTRRVTESVARERSASIGTSIDGIGQAIDKNTSGARKLAGSITSVVGVYTGLVGVLATATAAYGALAARMREAENAAIAAADSALAFEGQIKQLNDQRLTGLDADLRAASRWASEQTAALAAATKDRGKFYGQALDAIDEEYRKRVDEAYKASAIEFTTARETIERIEQARAASIARGLEAETRAIIEAGLSEEEQVDRVFRRRQALAESTRPSHGDEETDAILAGLTKAREYQLETIRIPAAEQADRARQRIEDNARREREAMERNAKAAADACGRELDRAIGTALNFNLNGAASSLEGIRSNLEVIALNGGIR